MTEPSRWCEVRIATAVVLAVVSLVVRQLALAAALVTLIVFVSMPALAGARRTFSRAALALAAAVSLVASLRFLIIDAMPGIVAGGQVATERNALWRLREIVRAEDAMRAHAHVDPDHDGIGSAALVGELMGKLPLRGIRTLEPPLLGQRFARLMDTPLGPAAVANAYLLIVCLPQPNGGFTARPGDSLDEERAERRFLAYGWPMRADRGEGRGQAYFVDEHERILVTENRDAKGEPLWEGPNYPPPCEAAVAEPTRGLFRVWEGKRPRESLPGDRG